jgi:putative phosphoesterase
LPGRDAFLPRHLSLERVACCIGIISDTHMPEKCLELPASVFDILQGVDLILHAGDVGELWVLDRLGELAPVVAVHGNDESADATRELPYRQVIARAGQRIVLCHSHFEDPAEEMAFRRRIRVRGNWHSVCAAFGHATGAGIVVHGHTHVPIVYRHEGVLLINPGAIAPPSPVSRQIIRTVALLYLDCDGIPFVVHVDVDHSDQPFKPAWWTEHDWLDGGVRAIMHRFTGSIVEPAFLDDSTYIWERLQGADAQLRATYHTAILRQAHRCWAGEIACITRAGLIQQLREDEDVLTQVGDQLIIWLTSGTSE